jgi:hypothetical protein
MNSKSSRLIACLFSHVHSMEFHTDMFKINTSISRVRKPERLFCSRVSGLSSKRSGLQAFNLRIRVRVPLALYFCVFAIHLFWSAFTRTSWCCGLVVQDSALSARWSRVRIPSAPPWERSSNGKTVVCETIYTGSIPVLSPNFSVRLCVLRFPSSRAPSPLIA